MNCNEIQKLMGFYIDREVDAKTKEMVEEHLQKCQSCAKTYQKMLEVDNLIKSAVRTAFQPKDVSQKVKARLKRHRFLKIGLALAAGVLFAFVCYCIYVATYTPPVQNISIVGNTTFFADTLGALKVLVKDAITGNPVPNARVHAKLNGQTLGKFKTDKDGVAYLRFNIPNIPDKTARLDFHVTSRHGSDTISCLIWIQPHPTKILITTDKPLYQPSQIIHIRVLVMDNFKSIPLGNKQVSLRIKDPDGNIIYRKILKTSEFGIASSDFTLADEIKLGWYRIEAQIGKTCFERWVEVKKYVLPKFKIEISLDKSYYIPGDTVKGTITANYFFGKPVSDGTLRIRFSSYVVDEFEDFLVVTGKTDSKGKYKFKVTLPWKFYGVDLEKGDPLARIKVELTDTANHTGIKTQPLKISKDPIKLQIIPEREYLVKGVKNFLYVITTYPDGRPAICKLIIKQKERIRTVKTDASGIAKITLTEEDNLKITATDKYGNRVFKTFMWFQEFHRDFIIRTDKSLYQAGESVQINAIAAFMSGQIYLVIAKRGQILVAKTIKIKDGKGSAKVNLPPEICGTLQVEGYRISQEGHIIRDSFLIFVKPAKDLIVKIQPDKKIYKPGEDISLNFKLTAEDGKPVCGAIGLSVVDEALLYLAENQPGFEKIYFLIEEDLLQPRWQVKRGPPPLPSEEEIRSTPNIFTGQRLYSLASMIAQRTFDQKKHEFERYKQKFFSIVSWIFWISLLIFGVVGAFSLIYVIIMGLVRSPRVWLCIFVGITVMSALIFYFTGSATLSLNCFIISFVLFLFAAWGFGLARTPSLLCFLSTIFVIVLICYPFFTTSTVLYSRARPAFKRIINFCEYDKDRQVEPTTLSKPLIREFFPETLYWNPQIITDQKGHARITFPGAHSITNWKILANAISKDGKFGTTISDLIVFQDFFIDIDLPVSLTCGDEISVPVMVYNYLKQKQDVKLKLEKKGWFDLLDDQIKVVKLKPEDVKAVYFRVRAKKAGLNEFLVWAYGTKMQDAILRKVKVFPDGKECHSSESGFLEKESTCILKIPREAFGENMKAWVKLYPSALPEVVQSLEKIVRLPFG